MDTAPEIRVRSSGGALAAFAPVGNLLSVKEHEDLVRIATCLNYKRGTPLYLQRERASFVYLIAEGVVRITRCHEANHRQLLALRVPGDLCGIPHEGSYFNSAEVISPARIYRLEWSKIQDVFRPETLLQKILSNYRRAQTRILILGQQDACQRLVSCFLEMTTIPEFFQEERSCLLLPVTRFDLADYLGIRPESIARAFIKLERLKLVRRISARKIELLDRSGLRMVQCPSREPLSVASERLQ